MDTKAELLKIAYEKQFDLIEHYSDLVYKTRVSIVTASLLVWGYILGVYLQGQPTEVFTVIGTKLHPKAVVAYLASMALFVFFMMENAYFKRFLQLISSICDIEHEVGMKHYCSRYDRKNPWPLSLYYFLTASAYISVFVIMTLTLNGRTANLVAACSAASMLPLVLIVMAIYQVHKLSRNLTRS